MASHAAAGDPRVRCNHDPRPLTSKDDDSRKRQASQSPAGVDKPVIKKPNQTGHPLPSIGNHAHQSSTNVSDPRRSNANSPAGSRRNSTSLNTNGIHGTSNGSRHRHGSNGLASASRPLAGSDDSTPQSSTAPVAFMSSGAPQPTSDPSELHASIFNALMGVSDQASELALNKIAFNEADYALRKAQREYSLAEKQFAMFPAIKEQKTTANMTAQKRYDEAHRLLQQAKLEQQTLVGAAASAIASMQPAPGSRTDQGSRAESNEIENLATLSTQAQSKAAVLDSKIASLTKRLDDALANQQDSKALQHTTDQLAALERRVNEAHALAQGAQVPAPQQSPAMTDTGELTELKQRIDELEESQNDQMTLLEKHADNKVTEVSQWVGIEIHNLKANINEANAAQHSNAQTIDGCLSSVDSLRASFEEYVSQGVPGKALADFQQTIDALAAKVNILGSRKQSPPASGMDMALDPSNPLGLVPFKPIFPKAKPTQPSPPKPTMETLKERPALGVNWNDWIESHIGALLHKTDHHEMRLNNTTTDTLYDAIMKVMKERYNKEYPDLVNWAGTVQEIKAVHDMNVGQLRTDVTSLSVRVDVHEGAVLQGQQTLTKIKNEFHVMQQDVMQLQGAQQNALERALNNATS
ncbi:hypothetical protein DOTSEDRAFT_69468 [Dothistroma septosporum NZE10]|uniref:Uncharacterized protein n=1 Tax=Dothistroma septosporum (strain NZE10 / CBS 128990) TaxID=675120 RepID=N1PVM4_DOTSN|nr:hypothetical protein DOTSEDRAFT_69468 [Dothistroma septosporum NZE10]